MNELILIGRLVEEPIFESSKGGRMFARARIAIKGSSGTTIISVIGGGQGAEVLAADIEVGDLIKVSGWVHGTELGKKDKKRDSIALILSDQVEQVRTKGGRN